MEEKSFLKEYAEALIRLDEAKAEVARLEQRLKEMNLNIMNGPYVVDEIKKEPLSVETTVEEVVREEMPEPDVVEEANKGQFIPEEAKEEIPTSEVMAESSEELASMPEPDLVEEANKGQFISEEAKEEIPTPEVMTKSSEELVSMPEPDVVEEVDKDQIEPTARIDDEKDSTEMETSGEIEPEDTGILESSNVFNTLNPLPIDEPNKLDVSYDEEVIPSPHDIDETNKGQFVPEDSIEKETPMSEVITDLTEELVQMPESDLVEEADKGQFTQEETPHAEITSESVDNKGTSIPDSINELNKGQLISEIEVDAMPELDPMAEISGAMRR